MLAAQAVSPEVLACLNRVGLAAKEAVEHRLQGRHKGLRRGFSLDFIGHRAYEFGDDLRQLDWQVYARLDRYAVRLYADETRFHACLLIDTSASMRYGEQVAAGKIPSKLEYAKMLAAALAVLIRSQGDHLALGMCAESLKQYIPPGFGEAHLLRQLHAIERAHAQGSTDLLASVERCALHLKRRGLVLLISDGGSDPSGLKRAWHLLRCRRQEVYCFLLHHPDERTFPFRDSLALHDYESGTLAGVEGPRLQALYRDAFAQQCRDWRRSAQEAGVHLSLVGCDQPLHVVLARALGRS